jgi:CheY-like chemotaxis protein/HPt (histidine-containing phosphotransfer) domain-containing protein
MTDRPHDRLADLGHEIRTPVNGILGMCRLLLQTPLRSDQRQFAESIREAAERTLALLEATLTASRQTDGPVAIDDAEFDLAALVEDAAELLAPQAARKGIAIGIYIHPAAMRRMRGDAGRLRQVLINLVANAVKFTAQGSVEIDVRAHPVDAGTLKLRIAVCDTGVGIAPDAQSQLFKRHARAPWIAPATGAASGGQGLGLAICNRAIAEMGGEIGVDSEPGRGSTFWFAVPVAPAAGETRPDAGAIAPFAGLRALVLDSDDTGRRLLGRRLEAMSLAVAQSPDEANAAAALAAAAARGEPFDLRVVELAARGPKLQPALERLARAAGPQMPRILICMPFGADPQRALARGTRQPDGIITRPIRAAALEATLRGLFAAAERDTGHAAAAAPGTGSAAPAVLVADDNHVNLRLMAAILESEGFAVETAADGQDAVEKASRGRYAAVLMDVKMPRMNGLEAAARIRAMPGDIAHVPIVALTANGAPGAREFYIAAGMDEHVPKPVNRAELMAVLRRLAARPLPARQPAAPKPDRPAPALPKLPPADGSTETADTAEFDERQLDAVRAVLRKIEFERLIAASAQDAEDRAVGLRAVAASGDMGALARAAQEIGAIATCIGARRLGVLASTLETACRERRGEEADRLAGRLADAAARTTTELRRRFLRRVV